MFLKFLFSSKGFGAAKNLSNYATQGVNMNVNEEVERVLKEFVSSKKPIGYNHIKILPFKLYI